MYIYNLKIERQKRTQISVETLFRKPETIICDICQTEELEENMIRLDGKTTNKHLFHLECIQEMCQF